MVRHARLTAGARDHARWPGDGRVVEHRVRYAVRCRHRHCCHDPRAVRKPGGGRVAQGQVHGGAHSLVDVRAPRRRDDAEVYADPNVEAQELLVRRHAVEGRGDRLVGDHVGRRSRRARRDGYYQQKINVLPYTISTALTGGVFSPSTTSSACRRCRGRSSMRSRGSRRALRVAPQSAARRHDPVRHRPADDRPAPVPVHHLLAEAFVDAKLRWGGELVPAMVGGFNKTVEYLLKTQLPSGALMNGTPARSRARRARSRSSSCGTR